METTTLVFDAGEVQAQAWAEYKGLVYQAAAGERPEPSAIQAACWPIDRSLSQFEGDVGRLRERMAAATDLERANAMSGEIDKARATEQDAAERLRVAEAEAAKLVAGPTGDLAEARAKRGRLEREQADLAKPAKAALANTADDSIDKQIAEIESPVCELHNAQSVAREAAGKLQFLREKVDNLRRMAREGGAFPTPDPGTCESEAAAIEADLPALQERIDAGAVAGERLAEIEEQVEKLRKAKLRPDAVGWQ